MSAVRVYSCDDDPSFTVLLAFWFEEHEGVELVGTGHARERCLEGVRRTAPDVVLLDSMDRAAEPLTVDDIRAAAPGAAVVVYSGHPPEAAAGIVEGTPDAFLVKDTDAAALVALLRQLRDDAPRRPS
jgi:DNA-binding NarL/FixJ family response regulator